MHKIIPGKTVLLKQPKILTRMSTLKNILITGGAGFIGSNLSLKLLQKGFNITVIDNLNPQIHGDNPEKDSPLYNSIKGKVTFIKGSVTSRKALSEAIKKQDAIIHLAAETGTGQSMYHIHRYNRVNVGGTALLLDLLANRPHSVKKVIVASSRAIYGEGKYWSEEKGVVYPLARGDEYLKRGDFEVTFEGCVKPLALVPTDEESKIHPTSVYGITKQVQEQLVMTVCPTIGIAPVALRYQNVYGPGQSLSNPYTGILSIFSTRIKNENEINIFEDGKESRDFVYIDDVVDATIASVESELANGHVINIGSGIPTDVLTVAKTIKEKFESNTSIRISGNYRLGDIRHNYADITLARQLLKYEPKWSFSHGVGKFVEWVDSQNTKTDYYDKAMQEMKSKGLFK